MRRARTVGIIVVLALLPPGAAAHGGRSALRAEAVEAEGPFPTQRSDLALFRVLGGTIVLGSSSFRVEADGRGLRVGDAKVGSHGGTVKLAVGEGGETRSVRVHVRPRSDGPWEWAVVEARRLEVANTVVEIVDSSGDGRFTVGEDAVRYPPSRFLLPLGETVVAGRGRLEIESISEDGMRVEGYVTPLAGSRHQLDGIEILNRLRVAHGLPPVVVDEDLSAACSAHAEYLVRNKWTPGKFNPHGEHPRGKGYSEAGHRAGMSSVIAWSDHGDAARAYWETYYHRFPLAHPATRGVGVSDGSPSVSVIDGKSGTEPAAPDGWRDVILVPADGSVLETGAFHRGGESPEPVEQPGNRGFPLTVQFLSDEPLVTSFDARLVTVDRKGREKDVPLLEPRARRSGSRFGAVPERPLRAGVEYRVTYTFRRDGTEEELRASFRVE